MEFHPSLFERYSTKTLSDNELIYFKEGEWTNNNVVDKITHKKVIDLNLTPESDLNESNTSSVFKNLYGETLLTFLFFSKSNINNIQNLIKFVINRETGYVIDKQSNNELLTIMRSVFLEYSNHPKLIDPNMSDQQKLELYKRYTAEVYRLNELVINLTVPKIISQVQQYIDYLRDANSTYQMDRPQFNAIKGERAYRTPTQIFFGGGF